MEFAGRVAVITGAGSGFGRELARVAASRGMKLALADINQAALGETVEQLRDAGADAMGVRTDVSSAEAVQALADATMDAYGAVHLLFNNAGVAAGGFVWESTAADWQWVMGANVWSVIHGVRIFTPLMLAHGEPAHIVNTASAAGLISAPNMGIYNVSKHAVVALSETLHHDLNLAQSKIGVSVLCPAFVPTGISQSHRNRPAELANTTPPTPSMLMAQQASVKAVGSGRISAPEIAALTFAAIEAGQFYIVPHQKILDLVAVRMQDIVAQRNPTDFSVLTPG